MERRRLPLRLARGLRIALLVPLLLVAACVTHAHRVREAGDAFSQGAEIELQRQFGSSGMEDPALVDEQQYYAIAFGLAEQSLQESRAELERDHLFGTAATIKALAAWRLGDRETALATAAEVERIADGEGGTSIWPRDEALCRSMRPLIDVDDLGVKARSLQALDGPGEERALAEIFERAAIVQAKLEKNRERLPKGHPTRVYLAQVECELAWVLFDALASPDDLSLIEPHLPAYNQVRESALADLEAEGKASRQTERVAQFLTHYNELIRALP